MKELLRRELWRLLLCLCLLTAAAALLWSRTAGGTLPAWIPAVLVLWCLLLGLSRRVGLWGPAALCLLALSVCLFVIARAESGELSAYAALTAHPAFLPAALALCSLPFCYAPDRFALRAGAALAWLGLWLCAALLRWDLPRLTVTALLPLPLLAVCEARFRLLRRGSAADFAPLRGWLCLVLILASLLTLFVPAPAEPYGYPLLHAMIEKVEELWHDMESRISHRREGDAQFGLAFNGMAEQPEAGGTGGDAGYSCIYVQPFAATGGPLYLVGNAWDRFDGRRWTQTAAEADENVLLWNADTLEHVYALWRWQQAHGSEDDERFFRANHVYVYYGDMDTRTMFSAMNALYFYYDEQRYPSTAGAGGILFDYMQDRGTAYRMYWLESNARTLDRLIAESEGYAYRATDRREWRSLMRRYELRFHLDMPEDTALEPLLNRRQTLIRARDLDTEGVSPRAAALAAEITAGCRTDYEKLRAIADYLQTNYRYELSPTPVPEGENFLDWLLFETGEGYCTWYATAAALLARSVGVPTRYVQGYRAEALPVHSYTTLGPEAAHAWCEGYVAGYGWVTVEATPGFSAAGSGWEAAEEDAWAALPQTVREPAQGEGQTDGPAEETEPGGSAAEAEEDEAEPASGPRLWYLALLPVGLALIFAALVYLRRRKRWQRYLEAPPEERVRQDLGRLLGYLRRRGYARAPAESIRACFAALPWDYLPTEREQAMEMAEFYESVLFGGRVPTAKEMSAQRTFVEAFRPRKRRFLR